MKLSRTRVMAVILLLVLAVAEAAAVDYTSPSDTTTTSPSTPTKEPKDSNVSSKEPKEPKDKEPKEPKEPKGPGGTPPYTPPSPPTPTPSPPTPTPSPPTPTPSPPTPTSSPPTPTRSPPTPTPSPPTPTPSPPTPTPSPPTPTPSPPTPTPSPPTPTPSPPTPTPSPPTPTPSPPTPTPSPPTPTPPSSSNPKQVRCMDRYYSSCYYRQFTCPAACADTCQVDCVTCSPVCDCNKPGAVCQDPRFVGADGITFYFHGKKDQHFCLVSDSNLHINAHFIGKRTANMGRDFTWVQALGLLFNNHKIYLGAQKTATWNDAIDRISLSFDGQPIDLPEEEGASWQSPAGDVSITRARATNAVVIEAEGNFKIKAVVVPITEKDSLIHKYGVTQEDCLAHLDLSFKFKSLSRQVNGVLGQTYASNYVSRVKMGVAMPVLGGEREFHSSSIFATDCAVARFNGNGIESSEESIEFADLNCASGFSGRGVVCKR
ncbi:uncharacterized protein LOC110684275 [Chenopodium quinoa]|uniref:Root cap n=1 Tax=Chenopodium quinoa TaxID=63459 RepID=A0A803LD50_CHEQI|nr:uncharacterized protein LOC110684275 [Chenopodium quinoa]